MATAIPMTRSAPSPSGMKIVSSQGPNEGSGSGLGVQVPEKGGRLTVPCGRASPGIAVPKLRHLGAGPGRRQSESSD
jgi:hypothetical protein